MIKYFIIFILAISSVQAQEFFTIPGKHYDKDGNYLGKTICNSYSCLQYDSKDQFFGNVDLPIEGDPYYFYFNKNEQFLGFSECAGCEIRNLLNPAMIPQQTKR